MFRRVAKVLAVVLLVLCVAAFLLRDSRLAAQFRFAGDAHLPSVDADFANLAQVVPSKSASIKGTFRGLPHNYAEEEAFVDELWNSDNRAIHGYRFYSAPMRISSELKDALHRLLTEESTFTPYGGPKLCGGYHADFAVLFDDAGQHHWFLVCFGCHEVLCFTKGTELICDLDSRAYKTLIAAWKKERAHQGEASEAE